MTIRLIASDLDGTLLPSTKRISARTTAALRAAQAQGIAVVFATGRSHFSALNVVGDLRQVDWLVCSNGATVYDPKTERIVRRQILEDDLVADVHRSIVTRFPTATFGWELTDTFLWDHNWGTLDCWIDEYKLTGKHPRTGPVPSDVTKVLVGVPGLPTAELAQFIGANVPAPVHASSSGVPFVEVTAATAHKGAALADLAADLGISACEAVAFGDNNNDESMLAWAGHAVAMPHAMEQVQALADEIAESNEVDGVARLVERVVREQC
jgi:Cof subfamily protein (haloacid dehalogenase superfamily)